MNITEWSGSRFAVLIYSQWKTGNFVVGYERRTLVVRHNSEPLDHNQNMVGYQRKT